jgi:hypothetical protein
MYHAYQSGRRGKIPVPYVVMDILKMPQLLTRSGVKRKQCIGEKVIANAI